MSETEESTTLDIPVEDLARWARTQRIVDGNWGDDKIFTLQKPRMGKILSRKMKAGLEGQVHGWEVMRVMRQDTFLTITDFHATLIALNVQAGCTVGGQPVVQGQWIEVEAGQSVMLQPQGDFLCVVV
ncbi:hypothetical protein A1O7_09640 [Cladophialophora yegresii CBS 114405]|uniref:Uncharacterized protein n=1 Tax=Cladophialophora yegresii CBS 114405 TaxID=1182544 RepID=W9VF98_9EURO|nr:uncharacterized protein A1O7_09640 [Cladophialophora yegresii CBS 114405]EXJ54302.1 hypothetical protein A1O7_09640 [Cladophialophora yegresii CBS 114405]